jgi:hypothetical protein
MGPYTLFFSTLSAFLGVSLLCVKPLGSYMADVIVPSPGIKLIDILLSAAGWA